METKDNFDILNKIKETLSKYSDNVPMDNYLILAKEYKRVCLNFDKLITKERERNRKFIEVKRELLFAHSEEIKELKREIDTCKREALKWKTVVKDRGLDSNSRKEEVSEKPLLKDDIAGVIDKHFSENSMQKLLGEVVDQLSDTIFNFSKITLTFFDDNKILLLQRTIYKKVMVIVNSDSSSLVSGITNTILRDHFFLIHELFAKKILEASNISRGVFKFFEQHFVEEENGTRWSSFAITRFMNEYSKEVDEYKRFEDEYYTNLKRLEGYRGVEDELEEDFHKHNEHMNEKRKIERLVSLFKLKMGEQEEKISEIKGKYEALVDGTAKTLLQKRLVVKK